MRDKFPLLDYIILRKNRLTDIEKMLTSNWRTAHMYIELDRTGSHHCIIERKYNDDVVEITDSFINFRMTETRVVHGFTKLMTSLFSSTQDKKEEAYVCLFNPPDNYLLNWGGKISKSYIEQLD
jgi:hypothetical protein